MKLNIEVTGKIQYKFELLPLFKNGEHLLLSKLYLCRWSKGSESRFLNNEDYNIQK